ncbi:MAG: hypothetical protein Q4B81_01685 [Moraxella sp.]|nr:hypothetical protein [Moraxella sp.]
MNLKKFALSLVLIAISSTAFAGTYQCYIDRGGRTAEVSITASSSSEAKDIYWNAIKNDELFRLASVTKSEVVCR